MDGLLKAFWPLNTNQGPSAVIPTYRAGDYEDAIDLQIKSLLYMFRRCNIAESQAFLNDAAVGGVGVAGAGGSDKYREQAKIARDRMGHMPTSSMPRAKVGGLDKKLSLSDLKSGRSFPNAFNNQGTRDSPTRGVMSGLPADSTTQNSAGRLPGLSALDKEKLDVMYSKAEFEKVMKKDEHRVLIDWRKNKFRSMCLLSGKPSSSVLPKFPLKNYSFTILPAQSSEITYITTLSDSNLYMEHYVSKETRRRLAKEALDLVKKTTTSTAAFSKNDRAMVIITYLRKLSVEVQVDRLYKSLYRERIKAENRPKNPLSIPEASVPKKLTVSPTTRVSAYSKPLTVSPHLASQLESPKTPKFYMKTKSDTAIPFSHRSGNTQKISQPTIALVSPPQKVQTTKPRITGSSKESVLSPPRSRSNSPVRAPSRALDGSPLLRKKGSTVSLSQSGPVLASPSRSISVSGSSKSLALSGQKSLTRKVSGSSPSSSGRSSTVSTRSLSRIGTASSASSGSEASNANDQIRAEVMAQTRKAVQARLEREKLLIESEKL